MLGVISLTKTKVSEVLTSIAGTAVVSMLAGSRRVQATTAPVVPLWTVRLELVWIWANRDLSAMERKTSDKSAPFHHGDAQITRQHSGPTKHSH